MKKWNNSFTQWRQKDYFYANSQGQELKQHLRLWQPESKNWAKTIGKIIDINEIFEWHKRISFDIKIQYKEHSEMVLGCKLCVTRRHEESHKKFDDNGQSNHNYKK